MVEGVALGPAGALSSWGKMEKLSKEMKSHDDHWIDFCECLCAVVLGIVTLERGSFSEGNWTC